MQVEFGFSDAQAKFVYDLTPAQRVELALLAGRSRLEEPAAEIDANDLYLGLNASAVGIGTWRWTLGPDRGDRTAFSSAVNRFRNETLEAVELDRGRDESACVRGSMHGVRCRRGWRSRAARTSTRRRIASASAARRVGVLPGRQRLFRSREPRTGGYARRDGRSDPSLTRAAGRARGSLEPDGAVDDVAVGAAQWRPATGTSVRAASGLYQQFPDFEQVIGALGNSRTRSRTGRALRRRRRAAAGRVRRGYRSPLFDREERGMLRRPGAETMLVNGRAAASARRMRTTRIVSTDSRAGSSSWCSGATRTAFSGWISYSFGRNRYSDVVTGETYWGDLDQRHTMNLYGLYRLSDRD